MVILNLRSLGTSTWTWQVGSWKDLGSRSQESWGLMGSLDPAPQLLWAWMDSLRGRRRRKAPVRLFRLSCFFKKMLIYREDTSLEK